MPPKATCDRCGGERNPGKTKYCHSCREALALLYLGSPLPVWKLRVKYGVSDVSLTRWAYEHFGVGRSDIGPIERLHYLNEYRRMNGVNREKPAGGVAGAGEF